MLRMSKLLFKFSGLGVYNSFCDWDNHVAGSFNDAISIYKKTDLCRLHEDLA